MNTSKKEKAMAATSTKKKLSVKEQKAVDYNLLFHKTVTRVSKQRKSAFTVDDVVDKIGNPPQGRRALGALMNAAANRNNLRVAGVVPSRTSSRRGAVNTAWKR